LCSNIQIIAQNWQAFGIFSQPIRCFYEDTLTNSLIIGGDFALVNGDTAFGVIKWNGSSFERMGCGFRENCQSNILPGAHNNPPYSFVRFGDYIIAVGSFTGAGGQPVNKIARFNHIINNWEPFGTGLFDTPTLVGLGYKVRVIDDELYVCGSFFYCDGVQANSLIKYDGENWQTVYDFPAYQTNNVPNKIYDVIKYKGETYVSGNFSDQLNIPTDIHNIVKFNGSEWLPVGGGIKGGLSNISNMVVYKEKLYIAGVMSKSAGNPGNGIAAWDGDQWDDVGGGLTYISPSNIHVRDMKVYKDKLYVTGVFLYAGDINARFLASWDGEKWCNMGTGSEFFCGNPNGGSIGFLNDTLYVRGNMCLVSGDTILTSRVVRLSLNESFDSECSSPVSVVEMQKQNEIIIYPNPSKGEFFIRLPEGYRGVGKVYDYSGKLVKDFRIFKTTHELNISDLAKGMYFIQLIDMKKNESKSFKVILH
jgi:hypothetical protein